MQALAWLSGRPYEAYTTSGNPTDLFFLIPLALLHAIAPPSFLLLRAVPALVNLLALPRRLLVRPPLVRHDDRVDLHSGPGDPADGDCSQPHLLRIPRRQYSGRASSSICRCSASRNASARGSICGARASACFRSRSGRIRPTSSSVPFLLLPCARARSAAAAVIAPRTNDARRGGRAHGCGWCSSRLVRAFGIWRGRTEYLDRPWLSMAAARLHRWRAVVRVRGEQCAAVQRRDDLSLFLRRTAGDGSVRRVVVVVVVGPLAVRVPPDARGRTPPARLRR